MEFRSNSRWLFLREIQVSRMRIVLMAAWGMTALVGVTAQASTISFMTPNGTTTSGGPVQASATITTGTNSVTVVLKNWEGSETSLAQALSDFSFTLSDPFSGVNTTVAPAGSMVCLAAATCGASTPQSWALASYSGTVVLNGLGAGAPEVIGPASHLNGIDQTATFVFNLTGVSGGTTASGGVFSFGSTPVYVRGVTGLPTPPPAPVTLAAVLPSASPTLAVPRPDPEPGTYLLFGTGLLAIVTLKRKIPIAK